VTVRVVLVGLPGVGKSTVGRALAEALDVPFIDVDDVVAELAGQSAASLLRTEGETVFREAEVRALASALDRDGGLVVATGGGAVETAASRARLVAEPAVVLLVAPAPVLLARLADGDRPLLASPFTGRLAELETRRAPLYAEVADAVVDATGEVGDVVARVSAAVGRP